MTEPKLHVVHIVYHFSTGGLENGVVNLINNLGADHYRHSIVTMTGWDPEFASRIKTGNVEYFDLEKSQGNDLGVFLRCNRLLKKLRPDILHTRNTATLEMQLVGWWRRVPLRIHGEHGWDVNDMHGQNVTYQRLRRIIRPFVHQYVALSVEAKTYLLEKIHVKPERVNHICNGVDDTRFHPVKKQQGPFVFGCVGRLEEVKHHKLLAKAFVRVYQQCQQQNVAVKLHLIGDGGCRTEVEDILQLGNASDGAWLAGNRSDVPQQMQQFDVFVLPSLAEGISNTILEAMATGLPVIATNVGGNPELVEHEQTGLIVESDNVEEMADQMMRLVTSPDMCDAMGKAARERVEQKFSIHSMTSAYDALYRRVQSSSRDQ